MSSFRKSLCSPYQWGLVSFHSLLSHSRFLSPCVGRPCQRAVVGWSAVFFSFKYNSHSSECLQFSHGDASRYQISSFRPMDPSIIQHITFSLSEPNPFVHWSLLIEKRYILTGYLPCSRSTALGQRLLNFTDSFALQESLTDSHIKGQQGSKTSRLHCFVKHDFKLSSKYQLNWE